MSDHQGGTVDSLGEEAAKLFQALQDRAMDSGNEYAGATAAAAAGAASSLRQVKEHIATGSDDCRYCPLCQLISAVRGTSPEVRQHLSAAAGSLMQAAAGVLATQVPDGARERPESPGETVDVTDDEWEKN